MGYLANKKHEARINAFFKIFFTLSGLITLLAFGSSCISLFFDEYRWQLYLLITVVFFYCLLKRFYIYALLAFILGTINYFAVSSTVGICCSSPSGENAVTLLFGKDSKDMSVVTKTISAAKADVVALTYPEIDGTELKEELPEEYSFLHPAEENSDGFMFVSLPVERSGRIRLGNGAVADFAKVMSGDRQMVLISVDLSSLKRKQTAEALKKLSSFISRQDDPIIIFGNFNTVAWSKPMSGFIAENGLKVKNTLFDNLRNLLLPPKYYILGYEQNDVHGRLILPVLNSFSLFTRF